jgi:tetratricopeptide (TPR) repeat protein
MERVYKVFVSATSADLGSHRQIVSQALLTKGVLPVEQSAFPPDWRSVSDLLQQTIAGCDAVICLVGPTYGSEPLDLAPDQLRRSYTQMEYDVARQLGKRVYLFVASEGCALDSRPVEDTTRAQLQLAHRSAIMSGRGSRYNVFEDRQSLRALIGDIQFHFQSVSAPRRNLPYVSLGRLFKGRDDLLGRLRDRLLSEAGESDEALSSHTTLRELLSGLGGVGKTRLAVEYAWRYQQEYTAVLFVTADSEESLRRNLSSLTGPMVLNLGEVQQGQEEDRIAAVVRWLVEHPRWCMILDNVDTREAAGAVKAMLARLSGGHILITSRLASGEWGEDVEPLELDVLSPVDAKGFLLERTARRRTATTDDEDAAKLAKQLDGLALGLEQAGAFIEYRRCTIGEYLAKWCAGESGVKKWFNENAMHYPRSLAVTWETTMKTIGAEASALLNVLAWFSSSSIPEAVLTTPGSKAVMDSLLPPECRPCSPDDALAELAAFSMVRRSDDQGEPCFSLHCVVQDIARTRAKQVSTSEQLLNAAVELFLAFAPVDSYRFENWPIWRLLIPHAEELWEWMRPDPPKEAAHKERPAVRPDDRLLDAMALYYMEHHDAEDTHHVELQRLSLHLKRERLDEHDPVVALAKNDLALMLSLTSAEERESLYREALEDRIRAGGEESVGAAETMHNLGGHLALVGRWSDAEPLLKKAEAVFAKLNGPHHWRTLMTEMTLAMTCAVAGRIEEATAAARRSVDKKRRYLGAHHNDTLHSLSLFAQLLEISGKFAEATPVRREVADAADEVYGACDPRKVEAMYELASNLSAQGVSDDAIRVCRDALELRERHLGPDHKATLDSLTRLTLVLSRYGHEAEAQRTRVDFYGRVARSTSIPPLALRTVALACYREGHFAIARRLLDRLLTLEFEVASTHCHVARIALLLGDSELARQHVAAAWAEKDGAPSYVVQRMVWLKLALHLLNGSPSPGSASRYAPWLGQLKGLLNDNSERVEWAMEPVIEALKQKLAPPDLDLMSAIVEAMSSADVARLGGLPVWANTEAEALS